MKHVAAFVLLMVAMTAQAVEEPKTYSEGEVAVLLLNMKLQQERELAHLAGMIGALRRELNAAQERPQSCI